jgi:hypothetical protein
MKQKGSSVLMIRPVKFGFNEQTASSNSFQQMESEISPEAIQAQALKEFDAFAELLVSNGIDIIIFDDTLSPLTPDSIFPNNWISFQGNNSIVLYPMLAENRRPERRTDIINQLKKENSLLIDLSNYEKENLFLEGTGSIVFDYENKIAYANVSPRTNKTLLEKLCTQLEYSCISFKAVDSNGADIYHTNVLMCIGDKFAVVSEECFPNKSELKIVLDSLKSKQHEIISIDYPQMNSFAGNMYQLFNNDGNSFIVMSEQAFKSLRKEQIIQLEQFGKLLHSPLYTIEKFGGGSARCMIAEIK